MKAQKIIRTARAVVAMPDHRSSEAASCGRRRSSGSSMIAFFWANVFDKYFAPINNIAAKNSLNRNAVMCLYVWSCRFYPSWILPGFLKRMLLFTKPGKNADKEQLIERYNSIYKHVCQYSSTYLENTSSNLIDYVLI